MWEVILPSPFWVGYEKKKRHINERIFEVRVSSVCLFCVRYFINQVMPVCLALLDLSDRLVISVFGQDFLDAFYRVQEFADGIVVIQGVDDQGDVFAHIAVDIVRFTQ